MIPTKTSEEIAVNTQELREQERSVSCCPPHAQPEPESFWDRYKLLVTTALCAVGLVAGVISDIFHFTWLAYLFYAGAYLAGGSLSTLEALRALREGILNVNFLMVAAALGAAFIGDPRDGAILLFLFSLSNTLEHYAMGRTRQAIQSLMRLHPNEALVRRDEREIVIPVAELELGDTVLVKPGERLPADGRVIKGYSSVDQSPITGESVPVEKEVDSDVFAGTINQHGYLEIEVTKLVQETTLAKIIQLVEQAQAQRAPTQRLIDQFGAYYTWGVLGVTTLAIIVPILLAQPFQQTFYRAMILLVVASPCALVISIPASILSAIAGGARRGVLFKGGAHLEALSAVRVIAFDKTGILTTGKPRVTDVISLNGVDGKNLLSTAAAIEKQSEHPLAEAIVTAARERGLALPEVTGFQSMTGMGVSARYEGRELLLGNERYFSNFSLELDESVRRQLASLEAQGKTCVLVGDAQKTWGLIALADTLRPSAQAAIAQLHAMGMKTVMLTGDSEAAAAAVANQLGIDEYLAQLLPHDKVQAIQALQEKYEKVAMIGDGVNDAPALVSATVGITLGGAGTDVALETADVVLMADDLEKLPYAMQLSRQARRVVQQNLAFALAVILTLITSNLLNAPWLTLPLGVVGHEGSTVTVVLNGLRLLGYKPKS
ncbi:cadmium-translocating P-type ATPase [Candidatus Acetothermia bacterium]|nr:cadmium-translocating P-type ATPase [Candidatus Acetothermia bacterium]